MSVGNLIPVLVLVAVMLNGAWMLITGRIPIARLNQRTTKAPAAKRWAGAAQIVGSVGVLIEFSLLGSTSTSFVAGYIGLGGLGAMFLCFCASWWVDYRARHPVSR
jgi:hypothetical protein